MENEIRRWNFKTLEKCKCKTQDKTQKLRKRTAKEYQNPLTSSFMIHKDDISVVSYFGPDNISLDLHSESHETVGCIPICYSLRVLGK